MAGVTDGIIEKVQAALADERNLTKRDITDLRNEISTVLSQHKTNTEEQNNKLAALLDEVSEYHKTQKAAQEERDKIKDSSTTIVVPPSDVRPVQPEQPSAPPLVDGQEVKKGSWFSKIW